MNKYIRMILFWFFFPMSFTMMILVWLSYYLNEDNNIYFSDLVDAFKEVYLGMET